MWQEQFAAQRFVFSQTDRKPVEVKHLQLSSTTYIIPASLFRETSGLQRLCINLSICIFGKVASYLDRVPALDYQSPQLEIN